MTELFWLATQFCFGRLFFFQAEDGIRDATVTGVQTCALPISDLVAQQRAQEFQRLRLLLDAQDINLLCRVEIRRGLDGPDFAAEQRQRVREGHEIGRASCRERGWTW